MKRLIKKPNNFELFIGFLVSQIKMKRKSDSSLAPQVIGEYKFLLEIKKSGQNPFKKYFTGVYVKYGKKYFVKSWVGMIKDYEYLSLKNEFNTNLLLTKAFNKHGKITTPKVIEIIESYNTLSVVYEYIDGKSLQVSNLTEQKKVMSQIIVSLNNAKNDLGKDEFNKLLRRGKLSYFALLCILSILYVAHSPTEFVFISKMFKRCLKELISINEINFTVAHRDLTPENIMIYKNKIYLLDLELVAVTLEDFDIINLSTYGDYPKLFKHMQSNRTIEDSSFLDLFIPFQMATVTNNFNELKQHYLRVSNNLL